MSSICRLLRSHFTPSKPITATATATATDSDSVSPRFKTIAKLCREKDLTKLVQSFTQLSENPRFRIHPRAYHLTIQRLASRKLFPAIEQILEQQKKYPNITKEGFAIRIISLYGKAGMAGHAHKTFDELPDLKCARTVKSFNALLAAYVDSKKYDEVEKLFRELPRKLSVAPDQYSYNAVIEAFCAAGSLDSAVRMLDEMEEKGVKRDLVTFGIILNAFYREGRCLEGDGIWERMVKDEIVPDIRIYNAKLKGLVNAGKISESVELVEEVKRQGLKPDTFSYNALIKGYVKEGKLDDARKVYDELVKNECVEHQWTYETLIRAFCVKGDLEFALHLCRKCLESNSFIDAGLLQGVVDGLVEQLRVEDAEKLVELASSKRYARDRVKLPLPSEDE